MIERCPSCGTKSQLGFKEIPDVLYGKPGTWNYFQCQSCKHIWLSKAKIQNSFVTNYAKYYTHSYPNVKSRLRMWIQVALSSKILKVSLPINFADKLVGSILYYFPLTKEIGMRGVLFQQNIINKSILDFGCGTGEFLWKFKYFKSAIAGIDPDIKAQDIAKEILMTHRIYGSLNQINNEKFDIISMMHVIEHLDNPLEVLISLKDHIQPTGKLVISTPNSKSLSKAIFGKYWRGLEPPTHIQVFSEKSLKLLLENAGFINSKTFTVSGFAFYMFYSSILIFLKISPTRKSYSVIKTFLQPFAFCFWIFEYAVNCVTKTSGEEVFAIAEL